jgi:hypothetical protein
MARKNLLDVDFDTPSMKAADWLLTAASFGVYLYTGHWLWLVGAVAGAVASWYRPMGRIQKYLKKGIVRRNATI